MEKLEYVRNLLRDTARHPEIAFKSKVSIRTFYNILSESKPVKESTVEKLYIYFKRREGK